MTKKSVPPKSSAKAPAAKARAAKAPAAKAPATKARAAKAPAAKAPSATTSRPPLPDPVLPLAPESLAKEPSVFLGEAALAKLRVRLAAVPASAQASPRYSVRLGATAALRLVDEVERAGLGDRLRKLQSIGEFDLTLLTSLPDLAHAAWYIRHRLDQASAVSTEARVPSPLVESASQLRQSMLRVLEFHFSDDPEVEPQLVHIRRGAGHQDLADDLVALAALYQRHQKTLAGTPRYYDKGQAAEAQAQAAAILKSLSQDLGRDAAEWADLQRRISPLLEQAYEEVAQTARYLTRQDPQNESLFPRLHYIARTRGTKKQPTPPDPI